MTSMSKVSSQLIKWKKGDRYVEGAKAMLKLFCTSNSYDPNKESDEFNKTAYDVARDGGRNVAIDGESAMVRLQRRLNVGLFQNSCICGWDSAHELRVCHLKAAATNHPGDPWYQMLKHECWGKSDAWAKMLTYSSRPSTHFRVDRS